MSTYLQNLRHTNNRVESLRADFSGLEKLDNIIADVLKRLQTRGDVQTAWSNAATMNEFDLWFEPVVRKELGKVLGIVRNKAVERARKAGAGSASSAVLRRMYKDTLAGNINIATNNKRFNYRKRNYEPGKIKPRYVSERTKKLNEYYGPDRGFVLRFLEGDTDVRTATSYGPTGRGSRASYGGRGSIGARSFFGPAESDMRQAAEQLGTTLVNYVEKWVEKVLDNKK